MTQRSRFRDPTEDVYVDDFWLPVDAPVRLDGVYMVDVWPSQDTFFDGVGDDVPRQRRGKRRRYAK